MVLGWYRQSPRLWENASKKSHFRKLFLEFRSHFRIFFEISKTKKFGTITFFYGKKFRSLAKSFKKLEQKQIFENFFNQVSLYVWASYQNIAIGTHEFFPKDSWDQFTKNFLSIFCWSHSRNPWKIRKISKHFNWGFFRNRLYYCKAVYKNL